MALSTARVTGLWYLALAITGLCGFLLIRPELYAPASAHQTLAQLAGNVALARVGIVFELGVVVTQAMAAIAFFRLFRSVDVVAAGALAAFGLVNATAVLVSVSLVAAAVQVALDPGVLGGANAAGAVQLLYKISGQLWTVGAVFFGLWLIPMGQLVLRSGWMPRALGWLLFVGGFGYVLSAFMSPFPALSTASSVATVPASIGEFWMIGYLLLYGTRDTRTTAG
ncbi:MAG: DUF4386 domain-containing protein [Pseudomonadota bacterium]|nr:DUF4386 domain-containing protein [Pseudomonadota bacterium]